MFVIKYFYAASDYTQGTNFCISTLAQKSLIKLRFICAVSSTSLTEVSKWLSSFYKAIFPMINDLWVSKHRNVQVPFGSHWILNDSTGVLDMAKLLKTFEIGSLSSFSTLVTVV